MDDDLARLPPRLRLEANAEPAARFAAVFETPRRDGVSKHEKCFFSPEFLVEALNQKIVLVIQHRLETDTADVALRRSINCVTEGHVISGHGLGDRARRATDAKKSASDFLPGADLGEGPVLRRIQIHLERLLVGTDLHLRIHMISLTAIHGRRKSAAVAAGFGERRRLACCDWRL